MQIAVLVASAVFGVSASRLYHWYVSVKAPALPVVNDLPPLAMGALVESFRSDGGTLLIVTSAQCEYCKRSREFHRELVSVARRTARAVRVACSSQDFARELGAEPKEVIDPRALTFRVGGTPTIAILDGRGRVDDLWLGLLPAGAERTVLERVKVATGRINETLPREWAFLSASDIVQRDGVDLPRSVVEIAERGEIPPPAEPIQHLPLSELPIRAPFELAAGPHVIHCGHVNADSCAYAVTELRRLGREIKVMNPGRTFRSCNLSSSQP
ncbi:MAG: thioredoxin family protein [Bryobacteraceae bacterium]|nr:thioredoxin family protein [Bryobacteraceae bacterium]